MKIVRVCQVLRVDRPSAGRVVITTDIGELVASEGLAFDMLARAHATRRPASVYFDETSRAVIEAGPAPVDVVLGIHRDGEETRVALRRRPTLLELAPDEPRYAELFAVLESARREKRPVAIALRPGGTRIEDVRA